MFCFSNVLIFVFYMFCFFNSIWVDYSIVLLNFCSFVCFLTYNSFLLSECRHLHAHPDHVMFASGTKSYILYVAFDVPILMTKLLHRNTYKTSGFSLKISFIFVFRFHIFLRTIYYRILFIIKDRGYMSKKTNDCIYSGACHGGQL